jgi:ABC-type phosphate/phosphonate transport system substrate-binding protein
MKALLSSCFLACGLAALSSAEPASETALLPGPDTPKSIAKNTSRLVFKIAVNDIYCTKTACECISEIATRDYTGVLAKLEKDHQITLELTYFMEVFDLEKAILAGTHDGVICKPWTAYNLSKKSGADFKRVADIRDPKDKPMMTGHFVTSSKSPLKSLEDLNGKRIAFGQKDSYEKNQSPLQMLAAKNIKPGECFYFNSCGENLDALMNGKVDVAVVSSYALTASCAVDFAKPEDFKTIMETPEMPLTSVMLDMRKVSAPAAIALQKALLEISGNKTPADLLGKGFVMPASWKPVIASDDAAASKPVTGK